MTSTVQAEIEAHSKPERGIFPSGGSLAGATPIHIVARQLRRDVLRFPDFLRERFVPEYQGTVLSPAASWEPRPSLQLFSVKRLYLRRESFSGNAKDSLSRMPITPWVSPIWRRI